MNIFSPFSVFIYAISILNTTLTLIGSSPCVWSPSGICNNITLAELCGLKDMCCDKYGANFCIT